MATRSVISARQINSHPRFEGKAGTVGKEWGLKPKDKMLIPHRLAIALCDDGWYVRDDIVWSKPNPMPVPRYFFSVCTWPKICKIRS